MSNTDTILEEFKEQINSLAENEIRVGLMPMFVIPKSDTISNPLGVIRDQGIATSWEVYERESLDPFCQIIMVLLDELEEKTETLQNLTEGSSSKKGRRKLNRHYREHMEKFSPYAPCVVPTSDLSLGWDNLHMVVLEGYIPLTVFSDDRPGRPPYFAYSGNAFEYINEFYSEMIPKLDYHSTDSYIPSEARMSYSLPLEFLEPLFSLGVVQEIDNWVALSRATDTEQPFKKEATGYLATGSSNEFDEDLKKQYGLTEYTGRRRARDHRLI